MKIKSINNHIYDIVNASIEFLKSYPLFQGNDYYIERFETLSKDIRENKLVIGVLGITSSGKSAFINVLLGENLLPEGSIPTSGVLVKCQKAKERKLIVELKSRKNEVFEEEKSLTLNILKSFATEEENPANKKGVIDIKLFSPKFHISEKFIVVDTPGLNAYGCPWHDEITINRLLPVIDIVILLTTIRNPFNKYSLDILLYALNRNLQNDQRIFFVQTCKDAARASHEKGSLIESKEENLKKHKKRQLKAIKENTDLKDISIIQVSSTLAKESYDVENPEKQQQLWEQSGFGEVDKILKSYSTQINNLMIVSRRENLVNIVKDILSILEKSIKISKSKHEETQGGVERSYRGIENLDLKIKDIKQKVNEFIQSEKITLKGRQSSFIEWFENNIKTSSIYKAEEFERDFKQKLEKIWTSLFRELESRGKKIKNELDDLGIQTLDVTVKKATKIMLSITELSIEEIEYRKKKPGPWQAILRFFSSKSGWKKIIKKRVNKKIFSAEILKLISGQFELMDREIEYWQRNLNKNQIIPLEKTIERKIGEQRKLFELYKEGKLDFEKIKKQYKFWSNTIDKLNKFIEDPSLNVHIEKQAKSKLKTENMKNIYSSLKRDIWHAVSTLRDIQIARTFLKKVTTISNGCPQVLFLGPTKIGKTLYLKMLLHDSKGNKEIFPSPTKEITFYFKGDIEKPLLNSIKYKKLELQKELLKFVSIIDTPGDENFPDNLDFEKLFNNVDIITLFFRLQTIGSSINDFYSAPYKNQLSMFTEKILYIGVGGAEFTGSSFKTTRLHELYSECYKYLCKNTGFGGRPIIIFEGYDNRYNILLDMLRERIPEELWKNEFVRNGGYFDGSITENILKGAYHNMKEDVLNGRRK
jgi:hypothetical protein